MRTRAQARRSGRGQRQPGRDLRTRHPAVRPASSSPPEQLAALAHAEDPAAGPDGRRRRRTVPSAAVGRWPPSSVTRTSSDVDAVVERDRHPGRPDVADHVGDRLLQDPVGGAVHRARQRRRWRGHLERRRRARRRAPSRRARRSAPRPGVRHPPVVDRRAAPRGWPASPAAPGSWSARSSSSASRARSGRLSSTCAVTPAWTLMMAMACATVSWTSRAIRSRSSSTRARASSSRVRSASSARSSASAAMTRRDRTDSPRAALMTDAPIRKNTQPMAARGSMSAAATSQHDGQHGDPHAGDHQRPAPVAVAR